MSLCTGSGSKHKSLQGTAFTKGYPGIFLQGGKIGCGNTGAEGVRLPDENVQVRHHKRGQLTMFNDGENSNGSEFLITLDRANMLDGYHVCFGEIVEGEEVLKAVEESMSRLGSLKHDIKIEKCGTK